MRVYTFESSGPALLTDLSKPTGPRLGWNDGPPTQGYWRAGDIILNTLNNDQLRSWTCIAEGVPGEWHAGSSGGGASSLASDVVYDPSQSVWVATNVQDALDEISQRVVLLNSVPAPVIAGGLVQAAGDSIRSAFGGLTVNSGGTGLYNIGWFSASFPINGYLIQTSAKNSERFNCTIGFHTPNIASATVRTYDDTNALADTEFFVTINAVRA